jgi:hypothetical protein
MYTLSLAVADHARHQQLSQHPVSLPWSLADFTTWRFPILQAWSIYLDHNYFILEATFLFFLYNKEKLKFFSFEPIHSLSVTWAINSFIKSCVYSSYVESRSILRPLHQFDATILKTNTTFFMKKWVNQLFNLFFLEYMQYTSTLASTSGC